MSHPRHISSNARAAVPPNGFSNVSVLIVGDLMLDQYLDGDVHRISPEAPVPVLSVRKKRHMPGGAANVALNVMGLRAGARIAGVVGDDSAGRRLHELLSQSAVDSECLMTIPARPTTSKIRIISGNHQIVRLDEEVSDELDEVYQRELMHKIVGCLDRGNTGAVILSDYGKGVLSRSCAQGIIQECRHRGIPVLVDPKRQDYTVYKGATCVTPNQKEFYSALAGTGISATDFHFAGSVFRERLECAALLVTQGAEGMTLFTAGQAHHLPALVEEVFDVSGAGDTVIATLGVALGAGLAFQSAVELANAAASIVVRKPGTTPVSWSDFAELLGIDTIQGRDEGPGLPARQ